MRGVLGSSMMLLSCESVPSDDRDDDLAVSTDSEKKLCSRLVLLGLASHWHAAGDWSAINCGSSKGNQLPTSL